RFRRRTSRRSAGPSNRVRRYVARRVAAFVATLVFLSALVFVVVRVLPGDPATLILGVESNPETVARLRQALGLDRPLAVQYVDWLARAARGDLGTSIQYDVPVGRLILSRLPVTLPLALMAAAIMIAVALPLGVYAATRHRRAGDYAAMLVSQLGIAVPAFWSGLLLILLFSVRLGWFRSGGFDGWSAGVVAGVKALLLPAIALGAFQAAVLVRATRSAVLDVLREDYVRTARAKGVAEGRVVARHALRNAMIPIVTVMGIQLGQLIAGAAGLQGPSRAYPFGTDQYGRDVLSRVMAGAPTSIAVGVIAVGIGALVGIVLGLASGWVGGWLDEGAMRLVDAVQGFPAILSALLFTAVFAPGIGISMVAIGIAFVPVFARLTRGAVLELRDREFVVAARALGARDLRLVLRHILPNTMAPLIVQATTSFPVAILAEAALAYLGLGTQPPHPSWGLMLKEA